MDERLRKLLEDVRAGTTSIEEAMSFLQDLPYQDLSYAVLDHHRGLRKGFPEVVFCLGKTSAQVVAVLSELSRRHDRVMATRAEEATFEAVRKAIPEATYYSQARIILVDKREEENICELSRKE